MARREHRYATTVSWTGNHGEGTASYSAYSRAHTIMASGKPSIAGSADPAVMGDRARYNPEELLVASLSACHMLWYLHLCANAGIRVQAYEDAAEGLMAMEADGGGTFSEVVLRPRILIADRDGEQRARELHQGAHELCFIARSVNFPVRCEPTVLVEPGG
ncbi:MAG: OsmC family protein [Aquisalimonadaceae bacterium]